MSGLPARGGETGGGAGRRVPAVSHDTAETLLVSIVTAPLSAKALPDTLAPVVKVMLATARIFPVNAVPVPRVAELPTAQYTSVSRAPPLMTTDELIAVVRVLPILKTQIEPAGPLRVSRPVTSAHVGKQWTPGVSVSPPIGATAPKGLVHGPPTRSPYRKAANRGPTRTRRRRCWQASSPRR